MNAALNLRIDIKVHLALENLGRLILHRGRDKELVILKPIFETVEVPHRPPEDDLAHLRLGGVVNLRQECFGLLSGDLEVQEYLFELIKAFGEEGRVAEPSVALDNFWDWALVRLP